MKNYVLLIVFNSLVVLPATAQTSEGLTDTELQTIESYIGRSGPAIQRQFGMPDDTGQEALVWTYIIRRPADDAIVGFRQFGMWDETVAGYRERWFTNEEEAAGMYEAALSFMGKDGHTIAHIGNADPSLFTDSLRVSRRLDNMWYCDLQRNASDSHATLIVADINYRGGWWDMTNEGHRIETQLDIEALDD